jgi:mannose/fructose/N-acetylgalactosamine-specific phosphotransferase system component IIC
MSVALALLPLLAWGTLVGLDLVSVPQMMIARPIVAGPVAGALLGDLATGLALGVVFELFQYDILPVGAARYPEYGPATVAAVSAAHGAGGVVGIGLGACVGLVTGYLGGLGIEVVRRLNSRATHAVTARLEAGDTRALVRLHLTGIGRDALRAALVTGAGLVLAALVHGVLAGALALRGVALLDATAGGAALAAGAAGTLRLVGRGPNLRWFAAGVAGGVALAWLR